MRNIVSPLDGFLSPFGRRFGAVIDPFASLMSTLLADATQLIAHPLEYGSMFQDRAGTTPVTEPGQLVGMVLDHGFTGSKPVAGPELVTNGTFDTDVSGWSANGGATVSWLSGEMLVDVTGAAGGFRLGTNLSGKDGAYYEISLYVRKGTYTGSFNLSFSGGSFSVTPDDAGKTISFIASASSDAPGIVASRIGVPTGTYFIDNVSVRELPGYHATAISDAARGVFRDVGGIRWVEYNGINTSYQTPALIGVDVDKAQLFAGVRKLSDASLGVIGSLAASVSTAGSLTLDSRRYASGDYAMVIRNSSANSVQNFVTYNAPITNVLSAIYNQSGADIDDELSLRVDGVLSAKGGTGVYNAGSVNFASAPIYFGAQGGTSSFFNGRHYATLGPITRFSATNATAAQIEAAEAYYTARVI